MLQHRDAAAPIDGALVEAAVSHGVAPLLYRALYDSGRLSVLLRDVSDPLVRFAREAAVVDTGVPGLDSGDAFCAAWSRFGGSWQLLVQVGAAGDPVQLARLEVIASTVVQGAYGDVFAAWPAELESEREVVADAHRVPGAVWDLGKTLAAHALRARGGARR